MCCNGVQWEILTVKLQLIRLIYLQVTSVTLKPRFHNARKAPFSNIFSASAASESRYHYQIYDCEHMQKSFSCEGRLFRRKLAQREGRGMGTVMACLSNKGSEAIQRSCVK